jgi:hypothetical protein
VNASRSSSCAPRYDRLIGSLTLAQGISLGILALLLVLWRVRARQVPAAA